MTCVQVFFFRTGQNWGNRAYFPKADKSLEAAEVLEAFLAQFYDDKPTPKLVLVSTDFPERALLEAALSERAGPSRRRSPCRSAARSANSSSTRSPMRARRLARKIADTSSQATLLAGARRGLRPSCPAAPHRGLRQQPRDGHECRRRDDRCRPGGLFQEPLSQVQHPRRGDHAGRRHRHDARSDAPPLRPAAERGRPACRSEAGDSDTLGPWPDLVLIDGGKAQFGAATAVLAELGIDDLPIVSIAKGRDREAGRESFFIDRSRAFHAAAPRPGALFHPAAARRGASFCHRLAPCPAGEGDAPEPARRNRRHRPEPQAGASAPFRHGEGGQSGGHRRSDGRSRAYRGRWRRRSTTIFTSRRPDFRAENGRSVALSSQIALREMRRHGACEAGQLTR